MTAPQALLACFVLGAAAGALLDRVATNVIASTSPPGLRTLGSAGVMALVAPALALVVCSPAQLGCDLALLSVLLAASLTDLETRRIPNLLTGFGFTAILALTVLFQPELVTQRLLFALLSFTLFLAAALLRPGALGLGDVKLAAVIGAVLGALALPAVTVALIGAAFTGVAIAIRSGLAQARVATLPLAPFLAGGVGVTLLLAG